jgi:hypothetical protein
MGLLCAPEQHSYLLRASGEKSRPVEPVRATEQQETPPKLRSTQSLAESGRDTGAKQCPELTCQKCANSLDNKPAIINLGFNAQSQ